MKKIFIAIALVMSMMTYYIQEEHMDALALKNVEALSQSETSPNAKKVLDIINSYYEDIVQEPEFDDKGNIKGWKDVVVRVVHIVTCSQAKGTLPCIPRKDFHSKDDPEFCPYNH
ncbi:hypothetical protein [Prevotella communis]|uniref:hypothetical protein n=1 Tax=Prevotella communis TaxID=2913614 RepID=UPI001EDA82EF|nr:hypothetical protein [Prevotella communis]UKK57278.1 hypothetical protein L6476_03245 [Prevotella communis]